MKKVVLSSLLSISGFFHGSHAWAGEGCPNRESRNIVEVAQAAEQFNTLLAAAQAAGLAETLASGQGLTLFAPTDAAFAKLPAGTVESLLQQPDVLRNILLYHVIAGVVPSSTAVELTEATMINGGKVEIRFEDGKLFLNESEVIVTDIQASNGVIHVIDTVLLP